MSDRLMRAGLRHEWKWSGDEAAFFRQIDETGGWPVGYQFVGFAHSNEREAGFCNSPSNTGWWTVVASADDYYLWKLSPAALQRVVDAVREAISVPPVNAQRLRIKNWRGYRATVNIEGVIPCDYTPDRFTTQSARLSIAKAEGRE